jgi:hypothetical protein
MMPYGASAMPYWAPGSSLAICWRFVVSGGIAQQLITVPVITPIFYVVVLVALAMGTALWLSALDLLVPRGQAVYVLGLIALLAFAAVEFLFFIA